MVPWRSGPRVTGRKEDRVGRVAGDEEPAMRLLPNVCPLAGGMVNLQQRLGDPADGGDPLEDSGADGLGGYGQEKSVGTHVRSGR